MLWSLVRLMRPHQWTKNLVLYAGLIFSQNALDVGLLARATLAFLLFCLVSASVYATNDVADLARDRLHPVKRERPLPSGKISPRVALVAAAVWAAVGLGGAFALGTGFGLVAAGYFVLNLAYSALLKNMVVLDVLSLAVGFVLRAIGSVEALLPAQPGIRLSPWLLVCTLFLALFLGLCKRRQELLSLRESSEGHRKALADYSPMMLDLMIGSVTAMVILSYSLYTIWPGTVEKFHTDRLIYSVPFVVYGAFRYLYLVYRRDGGGNPAELLLRDRPLEITILGWLGFVALIIY